MILVDSSVWIDFFNGVRSPTTDRLSELLASKSVITGDLILTEVLQGFASERDFAIALYLLTIPDVVSITSRQVAIEGAQNSRALRVRGITVRKTIDTLIATRCIIDSYPLLFSDRDFAPFVEHLGLVDAMRLPSP